MATTTPSTTVNVIVVGMAGSGKTTLITHLSQARDCYLVNLDPACNDPPYAADIDIRDTVSYKDVMREYGLGPNGAIVTSLNLYSTKIHQFVEVISAKQMVTFLDTPGQIEVFTWSASGAVISEALASFMPTIYLYVVDTVRCVQNPQTFMANMTYACSILYKTKLPLIVVFTKTDVVPSDELNRWMDDYETYLEALKKSNSFANDLQHSLCLALDEFYATILRCGVSAKTGAGVDELFRLIDTAREQYNTEYRAMLERNKKAVEEKTRATQESDLRRFRQDRRVEQAVDGEFCGGVGEHVFGDYDEGVYTRGGQRFFYGKALGEEEEPARDAE